MRTAIISDVHANLPALDAVLADMDQRGGVDQVWCLGDLAVYGPQPDACVARVLAVASLCIAGNSDYVALGRLAVPNAVGPEVAASGAWTASAIVPQTVASLRSLGEPQRVEPSGRFSLFHNAP